MTRDRIMIIGANGELGQALLAELGPGKAIAATRHPQPPISGYDHVMLATDGTPPAETLEECGAVINAAGKVRADRAALEAANVQLPVAIANAAKAAGVGKMVQVSSFSVYGAVEHIGRDTPVRPEGDYGQSKARGDNALAALADTDFAVESLRLPFMFSATKPALLGPLLALADRVRLLPDVKGAEIARSMISYRGAARMLIDCTADRQSLVSNAADPVLFNYRLLARILAEEGGPHIRSLHIPRGLAKLAARLVPAIGRRLFQSSVLAADSNKAGEATLGIEEELGQLARNRYRASNHPT